MNLLKSIAPFSKHIDAFEKGFGISDTVALAGLIEIWDAFKIIPANAKVIYQNENMRAPKTDKGCQSCVAEAMRSLVNWRKKLISEGGSEMDFKGDADQPKMAKVTELKKVVNKTIKEVQDKVADVIEGSTIDETDHTQTPIDYSEIKMPELKKIAHKKGIEFYKTTTKVELIKMIQSHN